VILGPTGTGKAVTLETITGIYQPDQGEIFFGLEIKKTAKKVIEDKLE